MSPAILESTMKAACKRAREDMGAQDNGGHAAKRHRCTKVNECPGVARLETRMDRTNEWLKILLGEDAEANDDSNDEDTSGGSSEDDQENLSDWKGDEDHKEDDSDCNGNEDLLEGEGDEEEQYESKEEDWLEPMLNTNPFNSKNFLHSFNYYHDQAKSESNEESYCPSPSWSEYPEWDWEPQWSLDRD